MLDYQKKLVIGGPHLYKEVLSIMYVNLKNKTVSNFTKKKRVFSGLVENYNSGHSSYDKFISKAREQRRRLLFYGGRRRVLRRCYKQKYI